MPAQQSPALGYLVVETPGKEMRKCRIINPETYIGRIAANEIMLDDEAVQEFHASIRVDEWISGRIFSLVHLSESSDTHYQLGEQMFVLAGSGSKAVIADGARIFIGNCVLTLFLEEAAADAYMAPRLTAHKEEPPQPKQQKKRKTLRSTSTSLPDTPRETHASPLPEIWKGAPGLRPDPRRHKYINYLPVIFQMLPDELGQYAPRTMLEANPEGEDAPDQIGDPFHDVSKPPMELAAQRVAFDHGAPMLWRYLQIMEAIWEPREKRQDFLECYFDPRLCPASFLPWLADWFGIWLPPRGSEDLRRRLLARAMYFNRWRGTRIGLEHLISTSTLLRSRVTSSTGAPFHLDVTVERPQSSENEIPDDLLHELIVRNKPAPCTYTLTIIDPNETEGSKQ